MRHRILYHNFLYLLIITAIISCKDHNYVPKPHGYFRIDLPEKKYEVYDSVYPFRFKIPQYASIKELSSELSISRKINMDFLGYNATLHLTYLPVRNNLNTYISDAFKYVNKHIPKANNIEEHLYTNPSKHVYGITYHIEGIGVASPYQFFITDSIHHFLRGALYFNMAPNNDSLAPVINYIVQDIDTMISSFEWKY